jgi:hypothetical protein
VEPGIVGGRAVKTKPFSQDSEKPVIAARLDRETYDALRKEADEQRRPLGSLIRIILEDYAATMATVK